MDGGDTHSLGLRASVAEPTLYVKRRMAKTHGRGGAPWAQVETKKPLWPKLEGRGGASRGVALDVAHASVMHRHSAASVHVGHLPPFGCHAARARNSMNSEKWRTCTRPSIASITPGNSHGHTSMWMEEK